MNNMRGSVVAYILITIFLGGLVLAAMLSGANKHGSAQKLDELVLFIQSDIRTIQSSVGECVQNYPAPVDIDGNGTTDTNDNPNPPFPMYGTGADTLANLSSAGTGVAVTSIRCPGASDGYRDIFIGALAQPFKVLGDTATYTTTYFTDDTEGIYLRISRASDDPLWQETLSRLNEKYSMCSAAVVTGAAPCANGCLYYWIKRLSTSASHGEASCPET